jgi:hypothetical protein
MPDFLQKASVAKRESKHVEFKSSFDPDSPAEWCELTKDIVALANSGGGIIVFGLDSLGRRSGVDLSVVAHVDPADILNKVSKYAGSNTLDINVIELQRDGAALQAFVVEPVAIPIIFQKPGTYDVGSGKQRTAFSVGTVYFRHGAKSEPGTNEDIRAAIERQLELTRRSWVKGLRKVVQASPGSRAITVLSERPTAPSISDTVRTGDQGDAIPALLTRDAGKAERSFIHEEISEGIFDEINNVIDANRVLTRGQPRFLLGQPIYYRVYAERQHVKQKAGDIALLFRSAVCELYAPSLFWSLALPEETIAQVLSEVYLNSKGNMLHLLIRFAVLLGDEFCVWLEGRWGRKWRRHPQPPLAYLTFLEMRKSAQAKDPRLLAARMSETSLLAAGWSLRPVSALLGNRQEASSLLSKVCVSVFNGGDADDRAAARNLDFIAYGLQLRDRADLIRKAFIEIIENRESEEATRATAVDG